MKYGYFDDEAREYVITNPKTPWPWINYLGNREFFSSSPTQPAATLSIRTQNSAESPATATTAYLWTPAAAIFI